VPPKVSDDSRVVTHLRRQFYARRDQDTQAGFISWGVRRASHSCAGAAYPPSSSVARTLQGELAQQGFKVFRS
jgi:hypothetical protein